MKRDSIDRRSSSTRACNVVAAVLGIYALTGCRVLETLPGTDAQGALCKSAAGAYFLPRKEISFNVTQESEASSPFAFVYDGTVSVADRSLPFCLDYLSSSYAADEVHIGRNNSGLLTSINSVAEDKSKEIAETLIETGVTAITGNPDVGIKRSVAIAIEGGKLRVAEYTIDPFDNEKLAEVNTTMAGTYGYCVVIEGHTIDFRHVQRYCDSPRATAMHSPNWKQELPPIPSSEAMRGILYRPNLTHEMQVYRRRDPGSRESWRPYLSTKIEMPNRAPAFSILVERTAFVKRSTKLVFDDGVLKDVTIEKPSEALEFMEIPLVLAQAIIKIPAEIIKVRIASTSNKRLLIDAQRELLATQRAYLNTLQSMRSGTSTDATSDSRSIQIASGGAPSAAGMNRAFGPLDASMVEQAQANCEPVCLGNKNCEKTCPAVYVECAGVRECVTRRESEFLR